MNDAVPIFKAGKLRPGIYKIQNIVSQTYVDMRESPKELCCRPATLLEGKGLWEILPLGHGYTIRRLEPGKPDQFCIMLHGPGNRISVAPFSVAWRIELVRDGGHHPGDEYVRFFWGTTNNTWDLHGGGEGDRTPLHLHNNGDSNACRIWKLILEKPNDVDPAQQANPVPPLGMGPLPAYDENPGNRRRARTPHNAETNDDDDDDFETTVLETTVTTTKKTVTRRRRHRAEGE
ncbi:hypothetical protein BJ322DRAFT_243167 [Thelephora terrestris]|uniref:Uncharacterized protein n=1 Tax=Thelephora terrestris TaxID=56493 RepID=A0A9P6H8X7_9AGAM|nr:hypothetical protein BJ322DRAFT_243167 [Thelephora terrestris]